MSAQASRAGWTTMKFEDFVENVRDQASPTPEDSRLYIGLEDLDSGSLHVKRWGTAVDLKGDKLRMKKGDLLFAKRNAYLRRVVIAPHDGFFSAHGMVLRPKPTRVWPDFLPFFLQSDVFMNRAIEISVGSLSPTINWGTLRIQEFTLPPIEEQKRIAEILWAEDEALQAWIAILGALDGSKQQILGTTFTAQRTISDGWRLKELSEVASLQTGLAKGRKYSVDEDLVELPYLRVANVKDGYLDLREVKTIRVSLPEVGRFSVKYGDVLITEGGDFDKVGRGTVWKGEVEECLHQNHVFCLRPRDGVLLPDFLSYQTSSPYGKLYFLRCAKKTSNLASINSTQLKSFPVLIAPIGEQERLISRLKSIEVKKTEVQAHTNSLRSLISKYMGLLVEEGDPHV
jgi:type I restriction enzyme S subunit